jgi:hypothetical protein
MFVSQQGAFQAMNLLRQARRLELSKDLEPTTAQSKLA